MADDFVVEIWALADALVNCPKFKDPAGRRDILSTMRNAIFTRVAWSGDTKSESFSIVKACVDITDGIDELLAKLREYEGETRYWADVERAAENLRARLAPPPPPVTLPATPLVVPQAWIIGERQEPKFALVIGVSRYRDGAEANQELRPDQFTHLKFAANDAIELHKFLTEKAQYDTENVLINEKATLSGIMHALDELRKKCLGSGVSDPTVLVYFSGHGARDAEGRSYLAPHDARRDDLFATALWCKTLNNALDELGTSRLAVFLDACHAGSIGVEAAKDVEVVRFDPQSIVPATPSGRFVVASCMAGQRSYEDSEGQHGIFTRQLLDLLRCEEPQSLPEEIELWELYRALRTRVVQAAASAPLKYVQEPFASFKSKTDVVLAINEPLRQILLQLKLAYLQALRKLILRSAPEQEARIRQCRRETENMLWWYCNKSRRRSGFDAFYEYFDVCWPNTDLGDNEKLEWQCQSLVDRFDELDRGTSSRLPGVPAVGGTPLAGAATRTVAAAGPQAADEAVERRQPAEVPDGPAQSRPPAVALGADLSTSLLVSSAPTRQLDESDADYVLHDTLSYVLSSTQLYKEVRGLRELLARPITTEEFSLWLVKTTITEDRIRDSIRQRFLEKWQIAREISHMSLSDLLASAKANEEVPCR
jgi:hypothetical protein